MVDENVGDVIPDIIADPSTMSTDGTFWMHAAQATIRAYCGWHVAPSVTRTITVDAYGGSTLLLPSMHVTDVAQLLLEGTAVTRCRWSDTGVLVLLDGRSFPDLPRSVTVTMTDGWQPDEVPDVQALMLNVARRSASAPVNVASQSVNGSSVSYARMSDGSSMSVPLFDSERVTLMRYRLRGGIA